jgi:hypothetical protein
MNIVVFIRLYGFHRRGGKPFTASVRLALRAFNKEFN